MRGRGSFSGGGGELELIAWSLRFFACGYLRMEATIYLSPRLSLQCEPLIRCQQTSLNLLIYYFFFKLSNFISRIHLMTTLNNWIHMFLCSSQTTTAVVAATFLSFKYKHEFVLISHFYSKHSFEKVFCTVEDFFKVRSYYLPKLGCYIEQLMSVLLSRVNQFCLY